MTDVHLRKYAVATTVDFALYKLDGTGLKIDAASATGDVTLYRDEASVETLDADAFTDEGAIYSLALSQAEMTAARIIVVIIDQSSPQVWLDKTLIVETYGNASAQHIFDLGLATQSVNLVADQSAATVGTVTTLTNKTGFSISGTKTTLDALNDVSVADILAGVVEGTLTVKQAIMLITAANAGKLSGGGTATLTFRDTTNTKNRIVATVDASGNRTAITTDVT